MWEDVYQVYIRIGDGYSELVASDMSIRNAILFVRAWMEEYYNDRKSSMEIRRQPMDYHDKETKPPKGEDDAVRRSN